MASPAQRTAILVTLLLFVLSSLSFTGFALWQMYQDGKEDSTTIDLSDQAAINEQQTDEGGDMLEGTKLENFEPLTEVGELQAVDTVVGEGPEVKPGATITAHYTGALAKDGTIFQSSHDMGQPIQFSLDGVIKGWTEGVPGMKVGGKRRLIIPADMAYGEAGSPPSIGPNEPLVFDIELVSIDE